MIKITKKNVEYYKYLDKHCQTWIGSGIFTMDEVKLLRGIYKQWIKTYAYDVYGNVNTLDEIPEIQFLNNAFKTSKKIKKVFIDFDNKQYQIIEEV